MNHADTAACVGGGPAVMKDAAASDGCSAADRCAAKDAATAFISAVPRALSCASADNEATSTAAVPAPASMQKSSAVGPNHRHGLAPISAQPRHRAHPRALVSMRAEDDDRTNARGRDAASAANEDARQTAVADDAELWLAGVHSDALPLCAVAVRIPGGGDDERSSGGGSR